MVRLFHLWLHLSKKYDKKTSVRPRFWVQNFVILSRLCSHNSCTFCLFRLLREFCVLPIAPPALRIFFAFHARAIFACHARAIFAFHSRSNFAFHARSNFALFLRIFDAILGTLTRPSSHAGERATALYVIIYFFCKTFYCMIRYWFTYSCGKIKRFNAS